MIVEQSNVTVKVESSNCDLILLLPTHQNLNFAKFHSNWRDTSVRGIMADNVFRKRVAF